MKLDKRLVDNLIRLTRKYFRTGDEDYLPTLREAEEALEEKATWQAVRLLNDLAQYTQLSGKGTYDDIYRALAVFGIIVEDYIELKKKDWYLENISIDEETFDPDEIVECPQCGDYELKDEMVTIKGVDICRSCKVDV